MKKLMQAQPSYIRCIKPNENKSPKEFDMEMTMHQIKYLGLYENVRIRRAGFAFRQTFEMFLERYVKLLYQLSFNSFLDFIYCPQKHLMLVIIFGREMPNQDAFRF